MAIETVSYIEDGKSLHTLDLHSQLPNALWVIFIHGGAWRDPRQTSNDGDPLLQYLQESKLPVSLASLNYRLSPPVQHPSHQEDVIAALGFLKQKYGVKGFVLVGHSAGACLSFQAAHFEGCRGIIGVEGIYDLEDLGREYPEYEFFVEDAFGKDKKIWRDASPTELKLDFPSLAVKLVQSTEDELLSPRQTGLMQSKLQKSPVSVQDIAWINGTHNISITTPEFFKVVQDFIIQLLPS